MSYSLRIPKLDIPDDVTIAVEDIGETSDLTMLEAERFLSPDETRKAESYYYEMNRRQYIRGRAMLRIKLGELLSLDPVEIVLETGEHGKPFLPNSDLVFNLSHSGNIALYAFSRKQHALGVDIEERSRSVKIHELGRHCFTENESRLMSNAPVPDQVDMFFRIWTAKEARMKVTGEGLYLDPRDIELNFEKGLPVGYKKPLTPDIVLRSFDLEDCNASAAIALLK